MELLYLQKNWRFSWTLDKIPAIWTDWHLSTKALRVGRGIALTYLRPRHWNGGVGSTPRPGRFTPSKDPVPIVQEAGWTPGPVWTGAENLAPTGIRSPDRPARSESLYRLSYPGTWTVVGLWLNAERALIVQSSLTQAAYNEQHAVARWFQASRLEKRWSVSGSCLQRRN